MARASRDAVDVASFLSAAAQFEAEIADRLKCLVELESPTRDVELLGRLRDDLKTRWEMLGLDVRVVEGPAGDHLVGTLAGGEGW